MNITEAKYMAIGGVDFSINATIDGKNMYIPFDLNNRHYIEIQEWVADGNAITPSDPYIPPEE